MRVPSVLSQRITQKLYRSGRSHFWLARQLEMTTSQLKAILQGERDVSVPVLETLGELLGLPMTVPMPDEMARLIRSRLAGRPQPQERTQEWLAAQIGMRRSTLTHAMHGSTDIPLAAWVRLLEVLDLTEATSRPQDIQDVLRLCEDILMPMSPPHREQFYRDLADFLAARNYIPAWHEVREGKQEDITQYR